MTAIWGPVPPIGERGHGLRGRSPPASTAPLGPEGRTRAYSGPMTAHACLVAVALVVPPVPQGARPDVREGPLEGLSADELYDRGAYLEAAAMACAGYLSPADPPATRLQSARLAQEAYSRAYETARPPRPEYLCQALDVLDATAALAVADVDVRRHETLAAVHRATLKDRHPAHVCEVGTELRPLTGVRRASAPAPIAAPQISAPRNTKTNGDNAALAARKASGARALKISGAVSLTMGVMGLAAMGVGMGIRSQAIRAADPLIAMHERQGVLLFGQGRELAALTDAVTAGQQVALAGGLSGAVFLVLGAALVGRAHVLTSRARVAPMAGPGRAGLIVEGRF